MTNETIYKVCYHSLFLFLQVIESLIANKGASTLVPKSPLKEDAAHLHDEKVYLSEPPNYKKGEQVATRLAYGTALLKLARSSPRIIALDGDTKNSTYSEKIKKVSVVFYL